MEIIEPRHISDERMAHIRAVAEQAFRLAMASGLSEEEANAVYVLGFLHDVGYALADPSEHARCGADVLDACGYRFADAVRHHGNPDAELTRELAFLDVADLTVDGQGRLVTMDERMADIASRHGRNSEVTRRSQALADRLREEVPGIVGVAEYIAAGGGA